MSEELIFESHQPRRFAPSALHSPTPVAVDEEFAKQLERIPDKMGFKIGEVADIVGVKAYVLRYWETEFEQLRPQKSKNNQRMYDKKDVEMALMIKKLLHKDRFSIEGARAALKKLKNETKKTKNLRTAAAKWEDLIDQTQDLLEGVRNLKRLFSDT